MPGDLIRPRVSEYYSARLAEHGATARGVDWNSTESQQLRFDQILRLMDGPGGWSLNDYGCGYGALAEHLENRGVEFSLHGYDLSPAMIAAARERSPAYRWTTDPSALSPADYTVCSGVFNVKLDVDPAAWADYVWEVLDEMNALSAKGMIFNMLTAHADPERMRDDLFYADPAAWLDACLARYGRRVALLHDYPLYEFTMLVGAGG